MSASRRALAVACHAVVLLWLSAWFAWPAPGLPPSEPPAELARVQPRPEAPPEAAPAPEPAPEPAPAAAQKPAPARPTPVSSREIADGVRYLDGAGSFPALSSSYEDFRSFSAYARAMSGLGARFVVVQERKIVGSIDPETGAIDDAELERAFSPRARDYSDEPGLARLARAARERFGPGASVMMLVPREIDAGLFGGIARALAREGESHLGFREIRARYQRGPGGGVRLHVDAAVRLDGSKRGMDLLFDLGEIARAGAAGPAA
jgi:hypothetical protein